MENQPEKRLEEARVVVNYDEPPRKSPPSLSVGPLGWMRENLFGSVFDVILTIFAAVIIVATTYTIVGWSITEANWLTVNQNFRIFMVGTYPPNLLWRLNVIYYFAALLVGFTIAIYTPGSRQTLLVIVAVLAILFLIPVASNALVPPSSTYLAAGDVAVESGTVTESPPSTVAFIARAGDVVTVEVADFLQADSDVAQAAGYTDRTAKAFFNAAENQLAAIARVDEIERTIAANGRMGEGFLTRGQLADLEAELAELQEEDFTPQSERYAVNAADVTVTILNGATLEEMANATLSAGSDSISLELPNDGWYIINSEVAEPDTLVVLDVKNVYPIISRAVVENVFDDDGNPIINDNGRVETVTIEEFVNVQTRQILREERPQVDGDDVPLMRLTDHQYSGDRSFGEYIVMSLAPLANAMSMSSLWFVVFGMVGYGMSRGARAVLPKTPDAGLLPVLAVGGWGLFVFFLFTLTTGVVGFDGAALGNFFAIIIWVGVMFFIGQNYMPLGKTIGQPLLGLGFVMVLGQIMYGRLMSDPRPFLGPDSWGLSLGFIVELVLWLTFGTMAFRTGVQHEDKLKDGAKRNGLIGAIVLWAIALFATPFIVGALTGNVLTEYQANNMLPISDMQLWGGFLLTFLLTAVGIVASFPIGVLLALGRRAHRYPAIKYFSILYIEFVRGVPLVSVLFMASLMVPLLNPQLATVPGAIRAMVGITMFSAAYLAENVRGGLQSIPPGQEEAAKAVGLNNVQVTTLIMLPQALRAVIPALVGQAISLFKDTSLVYIVGLADLTGVAIRVVAQSEFVGRRLETLTFISVIYFIFSYLMSFISRRIEESGSGSARR